MPEGLQGGMKTRVKEGKIEPVNSRVAYTTPTLPRPHPQAADERSRPPKQTPDLPSARRMMTTRMVLGTIVHEAEGPRRARL